MCESNTGSIKNVGHNVPLLEYQNCGFEFGSCLFKNFVSFCVACGRLGDYHVLYQGEVKILWCAKDSNPQEMSK
jgi:hypothetical protein